MLTTRLNRRCTTHHYACDCREYHTSKLILEARDMFKSLCYNYQIKVYKNSLLAKWLKEVEHEEKG